MALAKTQAASDKEIVEDVVRSCMSDFQKFEYPRNTQYIFNYFRGKPVIAAQEIDRLTRLAQSDPSAAVRLQQAKDQNQNGGTRRRIQLFYGDGEQWRTSDDILTHSLAPSIDMAKSGDDGYWTMTANQLKLADDLESVGKEQFDPEFFFSSCKHWLANLTTGVLWPTSECELEAIEVGESVARVRVRRSSLHLIVTLGFPDIASSVAGGWGESRILKVDIVGDDDRLVGHTEFADWTYSDVFENHIPTRRTIYNADGSVDSEVKLESHGFLDRDITDLVKVPEADGSDLLRGRNVFTSVVDYSSDTQRRLDKDSREVLSKAAIEGGAGFGVSKVVYILMVLALALLLVAVINKFRAN